MTVHALDMVQNEKFICEKLLLLGPVYNFLDGSKILWTFPKYFDLQKDKVIVIEYFILTPQIDPISSIVSKLSIIVQFVLTVEFLPFSRLVVSFNNTLSAFS